MKKINLRLTTIYFIQAIITMYVPVFVFLRSYRISSADFSHIVLLIILFQNFLLSKEKRQADEYSRLAILKAESNCFTYISVLMVFVMIFLMYGKYTEHLAFATSLIISSSFIFRAVMFGYYDRKGIE